MRLPRQLCLTAITIVLWLAAASWCIADKASEQRQVAFSSPDRQLQVRVHLPTAASGSLPVWSLEFHGVELLANCELGLETVGYGDLLKGAKSHVPRSKTHKGTIPVYFGKADHAEDNYCEQQF